LGGTWTKGGFTVTLFQERGGRSELLLEQVQLDFSFRNKFIIVLPWGHQVDNNTFSKMCAFKSRTVYADDGGYETKSVYFNNNIKGSYDYFKLYFGA
jgi:hypothetical protein